jgi:hypothetical protein
MTALLEQALAEVYKLPPDQQDAIAAVMLEELAKEGKLDGNLAQSHDPLDAFIGAFDSSSTDWADNHDHYLGQMGTDDRTGDTP